MFADPPLTKRQFGWLILGAGVVVMAASLAADVVGAGQFNGLGPAQQKALGAGFGLVVFGLTFLPLGQRPA